MKKKLLPLLFFLPAFYGQAQVDNYCLRFSDNGVVDCGVMPELNDAQNYTLQFWMNAEEWTDGATLISRGEDLKVQLAGMYNMRFILGDQEFTMMNPLFLPKKWIQVTLIVDGKVAYVRLNNVEKKKRMCRTGSYQLQTAPSVFSLGGDTFKGRIDEVRVWNTVLKSDYDYFTFNTLNKWTPQLDNLVAYYKLDQEQCPNVVDYKTLFKKSKFNHHGILSEVGVKKEKVEDNDKMPYLLCGGYTDNPRFFDWNIGKEKYLLANDLIILGLQSYGDGHVKPENTNDHAKIVGEGYEYLKEFKGKKGVLSLTGNQYLETTTDVLYPEEWRGYGYTFETWLHLDEWTEGAFLFKKMTEDGKGISIALGSEEKKEIVLMVDGKKFSAQRCYLGVGRWSHFALSTTEGGTPQKTFSFFINGKEQFATSTDGSQNIKFTGVGQTVATIGEGLHGKLDETAVFNGKFDQSAIQNHKNSLPMPAVGQNGGGWVYQRASARYSYDKPENIGWDSYSQDEWRDIMLSAYKGYRGYQVRISVRPHDGWQNTLKDANKRVIFAKDLVKCSEGYDGVELDLEWLDGNQWQLGELSKEIRLRLPEGKTLMVSCHPYGAYKFPLDCMNQVDGFTMQQYGPQNRWYDWGSFESSYNNFVNYGFEKKKIYMSYASTTSNGANPWAAPIGWIKIADKYTPTNDMGKLALDFNGSDFCYQSPEQVYKRAKFVVENGLQGIFYWDMGNDVDPSHKYCLSKACNYALNSNVEPLVTEVEVNHPTAIEDVVDFKAALEPVYNAASGNLSLEGNQDVEGIEVYSMDGRKVAQCHGTSLSLSGLPKGAYVVRPVLAKGVAPRFVILKK